MSTAFCEYCERFSFASFAASYIAVAQVHLAEPGYHCGRVVVVDVYTMRSAVITFAKEVM